MGAVKYSEDSEVFWGEMASEQRNFQREGDTGTVHWVFYPAGIVVKFVKYIVEEF